MATILIFAIFAYLLGSVSSAIVVSKLLQLPDPRVEGSGNPGTTNVLRLSGKLPAALTLFGDLAKGTIPVLIARMISDDLLVISAAALMSFLGHLYPIYFKFKGGKGVATALGAYLGLGMPVFVGVGGVWLVVALIWRYASLSAIVAMLLAPVFAWYFYQNSWLTATCILIFLFIVIRHRTNIQRLMAGEESKIRLNIG